MTVTAPDEVRCRDEQSRARYPDETGFVERDGVRVFWESYGQGEQTVLFLPTWTLNHSRIWKAQIPYFARHFRVLCFDPRGNGRSDRPTDSAAYAEHEFAQDAIDVMDACGVERAVAVGLSRGAQRGLLLAAEHPERVTGLALIAPLFPVSRVRSVQQRMAFHPRAAAFWKRRPPTTRGQGKFSPYYWTHGGYADFVQWWAERMLTEPHSTKQIEDAVAWSHETDGDCLAASLTAPLAAPATRRDQIALAERVRCPVLVIHGTKDRVMPYPDGKALAGVTGGRLETVEAAGHLPHARKPVQVNLALREFVEGAPLRDPTVHRADGRKRALYISSPIGLGHAQRDIAIARELRKLVDGLEIDWLAQDPVTRVLEREGETIHAASDHLANESQHIESESAEHDLHCFHAWRRMDEILINNFMVFHDVVREEKYDLWVGDEAWELDYYLHENPREKRARYAWLTDFVGWLPMPDGGEREAFLTADYNAEMIEHIEGHPDLRDRAIFVGNPDDIVDERLGPQLPMIRDWTERNFEFTGYVTGFDPSTLGDRDELRHELGYRPDEKVCIVSVGGSGVGGHLLRRVIASFDAAKRQVPELRMIVVAGPRIDPDSLPQHDGLEVVAYVHNLYRHLAACDLAVVQGGLTTGMELTASGRPFLYFPLRHHFEQNMHVAHRLDRYGAGRRMDFDTADPDVIAGAIAAEIGRRVEYRPVETDGARRAAEKLAELL
ncbi:MAG TPA: alpha/beta fold hydrolase [Thermoleophilaceae bacterium]|jgi:pimeloyl-ACP methyl ester carboxylesterase/predicted glycosyltransferase